MTIRRQPKGTPWGGQFARSTHDDDNDLTFSGPDEELVKTVTPTVREWELWCMAVAIFVLALMILVTGMDFSLGKLTLWLFG